MTETGTADATMQDKVFAFLCDPTRSPDVQRIDTHAASVFLERERALKIKRAIRFPFLDYSNLEKRKHACDQEIRINRQFAPQIYRSVVPITQSADGTLAIDGDGKPVEYAVEMTRFDERRTLDHLARDDAFDDDLANATADSIAAAHRTASLASTDSWLRSLAKIIADNSKTLREAASFPDEDVEKLRVASDAALSRLRPLLEQRGRQGHVRRCHGDLHLANIVLIDRKPVLFDAIEFDEAIASIDVMYDLAFTLMDLLHYGRQRAANTLLNRYLSVTPADNLDALATLPLLMSIRAAIRALVLAKRSDRAGSGKQAVLTDARSYFDLARQLVRPEPPTLIAVGGLSGTGKSVLARSISSSLSPAPGAIVVRSDVLRKQLFGVAPEERLPESAYKADMSPWVYEILGEQARRVLAQGHSTVADAVFARASERTAIAEVARQLGIRFIGLFLVADLKTRQGRISRRGADASDATAEVAQLQEQYDVGPMDWTVVDASGTSEETLRACLNVVMPDAVRDI